MMKRIVSIPLILLILFSGINVNIASHYCRGNFAGARVSLSGKLATCGMEEDRPVTLPSRDLISNLCCEDFISSFSISTNYVPSSSYTLSETRLEINHDYIDYDGLSVMRQIPVFVIYTKIRPPGLFSPVSIEQQELCVFQI
jgi:hypothetical protein